MNLTNIITDGYERKARLYPALLLIAPAVGTGVALLSAKFTGLQSLAAGVVGCGGAFLLTQLARDSGKKHEASLFAKWGGLPSIAIFRHRDTRLDAITKARYHKKLAALVKEAKAPTPEQEEGDPKAADAVYAAWSNYLRVNTRDTNKFALLFQENVAYGYRRNVWGLRSIGIVVSLLSVVACGIRLYLVHSSTGKIDEALGGAVAFATIMLLLWLFRFNADWVRVPADAYAERLAECAESFGAKTPTSKDTGKK
jgi:hypothetical protein